MPRRGKPSLLWEKQGQRVVLRKKSRRCIVKHIGSRVASAFIICEAGVDHYFTLLS